MLKSSCLPGMEGIYLPLLISLIESYQSYQFLSQPGINSLSSILIYSNNLGDVVSDLSVKRRALIRDVVTRDSGVSVITADCPFR